LSFYDFNLKYQRRANATTPTAPTNEIQPPSLKRSHSAISHLDTANETWMNSPLTSKQKTYDNSTVSKLFFPLFLYLLYSYILFNSLIDSRHVLQICRLLKS
jgi:hypothetical protein